ncbi:MAG: SNF2-related protein, partial [Peptostreptococcaceae bacterium]
MSLNTIEEIIKNKVERPKYNSGFASYKRGLVYNNYANLENDIATFYGSVKGDGFEANNTAMVSINTKTRVITSSNCDCSQSISMSGKSQICPHMIAVVLKGIQDLDNNTDYEKEAEKLINPFVSLSIETSSDGQIGMNLEIEGVARTQFRKIFSSFKEKKKLHRLDNGSYLDLNDKDLKAALELIDSLGINEITSMKIDSSKALYLDELMDDEDYSFIKGREYVKKLTKKFNDVSNRGYEVPKDLNATLREYQVEGYKFLRTLSDYEFGGILADEMGLGKTIQTIAFLASKNNKKSIVVTPTALIYNWKNEIDKFAPNLKVGLAYKNIEQRSKVIADIDKYDVILTTYGTLKNDLEKYKEVKFDYCIIDEAQNIKNPESISAKTVKEVNSKVRFALTGTPIENNLLELWSIFDFVMPGYLYNKSKFQGIFNDGRNTPYLKQLIKPFMLRRTKKQVITELPDKIEQKLLVEISKEHRRVYDAYIKVVKSKLEEIDSNKITLFSYLTKLRQLCLAPEIMVKSYKGKNSKLNMTLDILRNTQDEKVLIFSQFTTVLKTIGKELEKNNIKYSYLDGKTNASDRVKLVEEFNNNDDKVFLISLKAGGTGLNLTSASVVIHFDPWWNPAVEDQASDRAHRIGQKKVVNVIKLVAKDTIEERVINLQETKRELIDEI